MNKQKSVIIIGAGFGGLATAAKLAKAGFDVTVLEKNDQPGGRAMVLKAQGFTFDMGPTWYMMPDIFDKYFKSFGEKPEDYYSLIRLDPAYRIYFENDQMIDVSPNPEENIKMFERIEKGAGVKLRKYLDLAKFKYDTAMKHYIYRTYKTIFDFFDFRMLTAGMRLNVLRSLHSHTTKYFKNDKLTRILEFMVVFIGGSPKNIPALYSLLTHTDMNLGIWYPEGGIASVVNGLVKLGQKYGAKFVYNAEVLSIEANSDGTKKVTTVAGDFNADIVVVNADYQHVDSKLLPKKYREHSEKYWNSRVLSPGVLMFYLGVNRKLAGLAHHTLFLNEHWDKHFDTIFKKPDWPNQPLFYTCTTSITDETTAPKGKENLTVLIPIAPGLEDTEEIREKYFNHLVAEMEQKLGYKFKEDIIFKQSFSIKDFENTFHAFKGNAFGLAHTLFQTAIFRPSHKNKKLKGLYYTGHYTVPGIGVPMCLISGDVISEEIIKEYESR